MKQTPKQSQILAYNRQFTNQILNMPLRSYAPFGTYLLSAAANTTGAYLMTQAPSTPNSKGSLNFNPDGST